jgi:hypothetical protein
MLLTTTQVTGSNHNLKYNKDRSSKAGLFLFPLLAYLWQVMEKYILSEIFTLIPKELYSRERGEAALKEQFSLSDGYIYNEYLLSSSNAVAAFALPQGNGPEVYPFIVRMLEEAAAIDHYNKVVFHYSTERRLAHIVISTGNELKIANCFKVDTFESALYFLFLSIQQLQMNPKQCIVRVCFQATIEQQQIMDKFFNGVEIHNLSKTIFTV